MSTAYLSFNEKIENSVQFSSADIEEKDDILTRNLPLKYNWVIWEQIMSNQEPLGKQAHYSDATHKVAPFATVVCLAFLPVGF